LLTKFGILWHNKTHKLIKSYLEDIFQRAEIISNALRNTNCDWGKIAHGVPLLFLICINDLPRILRNISIPVLFGHDTSIIVNSSNIIYVQTNITEEFKQINGSF
jgi:hypothetical protein